MEKHRCIKIAHVNPGSYNRITQLEKISEDAEPTEEIETLWFIGLEFDKSEIVNIDLTADIQNFIDTGKIFSDGILLIILDIL